MANSQVRQAGVEGHRVVVPLRRKINDDPVPPSSCPVLHPDAMVGSIGDFARRIAPYTRANTGAIVITAIATISNVMGRNRYMLVNDNVKCYPNEYVTVSAVNASLGMSVLNRARQFGQLAQDSWAEDCVRSGATSSEGIIGHFRDASETTKNGKKIIDEGNPEKRLWLEEYDGDGVSIIVGRSGNDLLSMLRKGFFSTRLGNLTRNDPQSVEHPHLGLGMLQTIDAKPKAPARVSATYELAAVCLQTIVFNENNSPLSGSEDLDFTDLSKHFELMLDMFAEEARGINDPSRDGIRSRFDSEAQAVWDAFEEANQVPVGHLDQNAAMHVLKMANVYASTMLLKAINLVSLKAALAAWQYSLECGWCKYGNADDFQLEMEAQNKILSELKINKRMKRTDIGKSIAAKARPKLPSIMDRLLKYRIITIVPEATAGRSGEWWVYNQR